MTKKKLESLKDIIIKNNTIDPKFYSKFDVKRGLRNQDGSGVLAGLSQISSVVGSKKTEKGLLPQKGILKYRGIPLDSIVSDHMEDNHFNFEKICYLLLVGEFPSEDTFKIFKEYMSQHRQLPTKMVTNIIEQIPSKNIMNKLQTCLSTLYAFDDQPDSLDPFDNFLKSVQILAKLPLILSYCFLSAFKENPQYVLPEPHMSTSEAFLYTLFEGKEVDPFSAHIMDLSFILHAEHGGGNNSSFTTYVVTSSGTDIYSAITSAIASLKGPLHGAANKKVRQMMSDIKENVSDWSNTNEITSYLEKIIRKQAGDLSGKIYGLGHAVYTQSDPRAEAIKQVASQIAKKMNREKEYNLYLSIEKHGPDVFNNVKKSNKVISPNVDFFSGFVYDCLDLPLELYTPIFALGRCAGWCAHRIEELLSGKRIIRPAYKFVDKHSL